MTSTNTTLTSDKIAQELADFCLATGTRPDKAWTSVQGYLVKLMNDMPTTINDELDGMGYSVAKFVYDKIGFDASPTTKQLEAMRDLFVYLQKQSHKQLRKANY